MGKTSRTKGRAGQTQARQLLESRDWTCGDLSGGIESEDLLAIDGDGNTWAVEVKNTASINVRAHKKQAMTQATKRRAKWMLMCRIDGYAGAWLVMRQGCNPVVWSVSSDMIEPQHDSTR